MRRTPPQYWFLHERLIILPSSLFPCPYPFRGCWPNLQLPSLAFIAWDIIWPPKCARSREQQVRTGQRLMPSPLPTQLPLTSDRKNWLYKYASSLPGWLAVAESRCMFYTSFQTTQPEQAPLGHEGKVLENGNFLGCPFSLSHFFITLPLLPRITCQINYLYSKLYLRDHFLKQHFKRAVYHGPRLELYKEKAKPWNQFVFTMASIFVV